MAKIFRRIGASFFRFLAIFSHKISNLFLSLSAGMGDITAVQKQNQQMWDSDTQFWIQEAPQVLSGLMAWEIPIMEHFKPGGIIGVIGCGAGRDMIAFAREGFDVEGVDVAGKAVEAAKIFLTKEGVSAKVYQGDVSDFLFPGSIYDAFVFSWFTYCYIFPKEKRVAALKNIYPKLSDDGCVVLTVLPYHGECYAMTKLAGIVGKLTGNALAPVSGDVFKLNGHVEHLFTREEIEMEAEEAGFHVEVYKADTQVIAILKKSAKRDT